MVVFVWMALAVIACGPAEIAPETKEADFRESPTEGSAKSTNTRSGP